jgi:hypothetical protein
MSRSNPQVNLTNPATRFFQWRADKGELSYYDRDLKQSIDVPFPFRFLVRDVLAMAGGGTKKFNEYVKYFSNMVRPHNLKKEAFTVRSRTGKHTVTEATGYWGDIKPKLQGVKFVNAIFCAFYDENKTLQIGMLKLQGAAGAAWFDFNKGRGTCSGVHTISGRSEPLQNGNITYYQPVFSWSDKVSDETNNSALDLDVQLQAYLNAYFEQKPSESSSEDTQYDQTEPTHSGPPQAQAAAAHAGEYRHGHPGETSPTNVPSTIAEKPAATTADGRHGAACDCSDCDIPF